MCTLVILYEIHKDRTQKRLPITAATRAVVGMSVFVVLVGVGWFFSTWAISSVMGCRMQGFVLQLALGPPLYNAAILLYANLSIVHRWPAKDIRQIELIIHPLIWIWCLFFASMLWVKDKYHSIGPVCWASDPPICYESEATDADLHGIHCNVKLYSALFYCFPLWLALGYTVYGCVGVLVHVRGLPKRTVAADNDTLEQRARTLTLLYTAAIAITYLPCIVWSLTLWFDYSTYWLTLLYVLLEPLQGAWNLTIFLMNRRQATRERIWKFMQAVLNCGGSCAPKTPTPDISQVVTNSEEEDKPQNESSWTISDRKSLEACI